MTGKDWMTRIADGPCVLCRHLGVGDEQYGRTTIHHMREGQGMSQRASDFLSIGLCKEHHQGATGFHGLGARGFYQRYKLSEVDLLGMTIREALSQL